MGMTCKNTITNNTNILIVGDLGSNDWKCGSYGEKIKRAKEMQEKGLDILIIGENDFFKVVSRNG